MAKQVRLYNISDIQLSIFESQPPKLGVAVSGQATTTGWKNIELVPLEKTLSPDGILDLDFVGEPPEGISIPVITPVSAHFVWADDVDRLVGVTGSNGSVFQASQVGATGLMGALETPLTPLWVWLVFAETPSLPTLAGGALVLVAVGWFILHESGRRTS